MTSVIAATAASVSFMPVWGWVILWIVLVLALLGTLALLGWRLFRKALGVLDEAAKLAELTEILDRVVEADEQRPLNAILDDPDEVRARRRERTRRRATLKQARRELRLQRAKMITTQDVRGRKWPDAW